MTALGPLLGLVDVCGIAEPPRLRHYRMGSTFEEPQSSARQDVTGAALATNQPYTIRGALS